MANSFVRRLNITFTYSMPAFGEERAKLLVATQEAVLKVPCRPRLPSFSWVLFACCCDGANSFPLLRLSTHVWMRREHQHAWSGLAGAAARTVLK